MSTKSRATRELFYGFELTNFNLLFHYEIKRLSWARLQKMAYRANFLMKKEEKQSRKCENKKKYEKANKPKKTFFVGDSNPLLSNFI